MLILLHIVYDCFYATVTQLSGCNEDLTYLLLDALKNKFADP